MIGLAHVRRTMETRYVTTEEQPSRQQLMDEAADWLARLDSGAAKPADFEAWRNADPRRASAFVQIANAAQALDRAKPVLRTYPRPDEVHRRGFLFVGLSISAAVLAGGAAVMWSTRRAVASTLVGQRRSVTLPNGAGLELNTDSKAAWRVSNDGMQVWLERGEIALIIRQPEQACILHTDDNIADIGVGRVNARLRGKMLDLTVLSGQSTVRAKAGAASMGPGKSPPLVVRANEAVLSNADRQVVRALDIQDVQFLAGWPQGELAFEGQTLDTAVAEYNRYLSHKIIIADPSLASVKLGGRFSSADPSVFLEALNSSFGIRASTDDTGTTVLTK